MGCCKSSTAAVVTPTVQPLSTEEFDEKDDANLMYSQLFKELVEQIPEHDRSKVISYCPDLYTKRNLGILISTKPQLLDHTNLMRRKIQDKNPLFALGHLLLEMGSYDRAEYFYLKSLSQRTNDWKHLSIIYNNLSTRADKNRQKRMETL
ncbi:hypothetical protein I4U23_003536 [Adineta vaga]|nr:hypothetical protein I4U23_003536 [Adineta vaga]